MSDNIPFDIQVEIIKRLPVKSLIQFRSMSKKWKSLIDSSNFVTDYSRCQHAETQHMFVRYEEYEGGQYLSIVDDDTFPRNRVFLTYPVLLQLREYHSIIGYSHGLFCFYCEYIFGCDGPIFDTGRAVVCNPYIRKHVDLVVPNVVNGKLYETVLGFGVCRETMDPKIVKITHTLSSDDPWQVEVYTLSTGAWRSLSSNLPSKLVQFIHIDCCSVVIDGVLYWIATEMSTMDGRQRYLIISFDITTEEFGEVNLPNGFAHYQDGHCLSLSKLRESLVVFDKMEEANRIVHNVWMMEGGVPKSFTKLFSIYINTPDSFNTDDANALGFRKTGEPMIEKSAGDRARLVVYEPHSEHMDDLGFDGCLLRFFVHPYMETLLLLDQPNLAIHNELETLNIQDDLVS